MKRIGIVREIPRDFEWRIENFSSLSAKNHECYFSPLFRFGNESWCLKIYPNGQENKSTGYLDVYLIRKCSGPTIKLYYSLILKTMDEKTDREWHFWDCFKNTQTGHGYGKLLSRAELLKRKSELGLPDVLTVICRMRNSEYTDDASTSKSATANCSYCQETFCAKIISFHEEQCFDKPLKCTDCSDVMKLKDCHNHDCEKSTAEGKRVTVECSYCKKLLEANSITVHEGKCLDKPIKCPECSDVIKLKDWHDHECQRSRAEDKSTAECSYSKKKLEANNITFHEEKCVDKPTKCRECSDVIKLKDWHDHECQKTRVEALEKLIYDLKQMMLSGENGDVIINVKGEEFPLHRDVLAARNFYFNAMFKNDVKERNTGVVSIDDCEPDVFRDFIHFIYTGKVDKLTAETVCELYLTSDKYQEDQLKKICLDFMMKTISEDSFWDFFSLALKYDERKLFEKAVEFFIPKAKKIVRSVKWQNFALDYPTQANELIIKMLDHIDK